MHAIYNNTKTGTTFSTAVEKTRTLHTHSCPASSPLSGNKNSNNCGGFALKHTPKSNPNKKDATSTDIHSLPLIAFRQAAQSFVWAFSLSRISSRGSTGPMSDGSTPYWSGRKEATTTPYNTLWEVGNAKGGTVSLAEVGRERYRITVPSASTRPPFVPRRSFFGREGIFQTIWWAVPSFAGVCVSNFEGSNFLCSRVL